MSDNDARRSAAAHILPITGVAPTEHPAPNGHSCRDFRDDVIEAQADYIAALEADVVTYRDLLIRSWAHAHSLQQQNMRLSATVQRLRAEIRDQVSGSQPLSVCLPVFNPISPEATIQ